MPVAANGCVVPFAIEGLGGVTWIETSVAAVTVSRVEPVLPPALAVMVAVPAVIPVANPCDPAALDREATASSELVQPAAAVRSWVELSLKVPVTANAWVVPLAMD